MDNVSTSNITFYFISQKIIYLLLLDFCINILLAIILLHNFYFI